MIRMSAAELTSVFPGSSTSDADYSFEGVEIDSRKPCDGRLFIAIKGEQFDGHDFVAAAQEKGAVAALVETPVDCPMPQLVVSDTRQAMAELARYWRRQLNPTVVAITGSNGKTTVKEMLGQILAAQQPILVTQGNLNNDIGVPLTLFRLSAEHRFAVIEMGANHRHEIRQLVGIAEPDIVYVNNAQAAHVEGFGSLQGVVEAKGEMYQFCSPGACAVFNADEPAVEYWRSVVATQNHLSFSSQYQADVTAEVELQQGIGLQLAYAGQQAQCQLQLFGAHNAQNALAAITLAVACGLQLAAAAQALEAFQGVAGRQQLVKGVKDSTLINDSYNANPDSLSVAIHVMCEMPGEHWLALGDMAELGAQALDFHKQAATQAQQAGVTRFFALGDMSCQAAREFGAAGHCFSSHQEMADFIEQQIDSNVVLLVKGSRSAGMEQVVSLLTQHNANNHPSGVSHAV
ncbi:MAG: UDP-N-acetylmuramoyl-tripeptide--D-alanyl-D-alanine ligase [Gammaproteobacteria bacterium]|nr:UDP-N-acetylmuramoyl-tripeptide--D-alanyl-D-alanine ligase [Gammaproteobacteria bacterium]